MRERVNLGIDILVRDGFKRFKNQRVGLIINPSSVDRTLTSTLDVFLKGKVKLTALFGPEHGIRGESSGSTRGLMGFIWKNTPSWVL